MPDPAFAFDPTSDTDESQPDSSALSTDGGVEYRADDETIWRCENADRLCSDYHITGQPSELAVKLRQWHAAFCPVPQTWEILRRLYVIAPLVGSATLKDFRTWTLSEIAGEQNVSVADVEKHLNDTRNHWHRTQLQSGLVGRMSRSVAASIDPRTRGDLLRKYGFERFAESPHADYLAGRIGDMGAVLEMETGRPIALSAIFQELVLRSIQSKMSDNMLTKSTEGISKLHKEYMEAQSQYEETMKRLGATQEQNPGFRAKVAFNDCVGQIIAAIQDYTERGDTRKADGLFTEAEIELLMTPTPLRPHQYRPDLAALAALWRKHFWDPAWDGAVIPPKKMTLLLKAFDAAVEAEGAPVDTADETASEPWEDAAEVEDALALPADTGESDPDADPSDAALPASVPRLRAASELTPM